MVLKDNECWECECPEFELVRKTVDTPKRQQWLIKCKECGELHLLSFHNPPQMGEPYLESYDDEGEKDGYDYHTGLNYFGFNKDGLNEFGFNYDNLHHKTGTNRDEEGFDIDGYDIDGYDRDGFTKRGKDFKKWDRDGYDEMGFDINGIHKITGTNRDEEGYDIEGYNEEGFDSEGYDREGYDREGYDQEGYDIDGYDRDGYNEYGFTKDGVDGRMPLGRDADYYN